MRTRSGSLAAVMARVPSHPAHSGVLCICAERANSRQIQIGRYGAFNTADGTNALLNTTGIANYGIRLVFALFASPPAASILALVLERWPSTKRRLNTAVGAAALILNVNGTRNTAVGAAAMVNNAGDADGNGSFNDAVGAFALNGNTTGFSNNAMGDSALFRNHIGAANTAVGDLALENNDATGDGAANNNVAVGASALFNNVSGSENTAVGTGAGPNIGPGFNNTYVGDFVGTNAGDEDSTIRIGDLSNGNGAGSLACFIGGIFNNPQPVGGNVVVVTLNLDTDQLGFDGGTGQEWWPHLLCLIVTHLNLACAPSPRTKPCSMTKLRSCKQRSRSNKQRSRSNRNK